MPKKTTKGACVECGTQLTTRTAKKHLLSCLSKRAPGGKAKERLYLLLVEGYGISDDHYWMYLLAPEHAVFKDLDRLLRRTWLECCGHMSQFRDGRVSVSMSRKLADVLDRGLKLLYDYDFGDTTTLLLTVAGEIEGRIKRGKAEIVARNSAPEIACVQCREPAIDICPQCAYDDAGFMCRMCAQDHDCGLGAFLPVVNSPRAGVCGYAG